MIKLVLVRHGESIWNKENKFTGWMDVDLSDNGIKEAKTIFIKNENDYYALLDGKKYQKDSLTDTVSEVLKKICMDKKEIVIILKGINMPDSLLDDVVDLISNEYPDLEIGVIDAMQDDYDLIIGVN